MNIRLFILCAILGLGMSCQSEESSPDEWDKMMAIHDSVMPEMGTIMKFRSRLADLRDSIQHTTFGKDSTMAVRIIVSGMDDLDLAHESMMDWMAKLKRENEIEDDQREPYIREETEKIREVKRNMKLSIEQAETILKQYGKE